MLPGGVEDSPGAAVAPQSLYLTQLAERLGPQALQNLGYSSANPSSATISAAAEGSKTAIAPAPRTAADAALGENLALDRPVLTSNMRGGDRKFAGWQALDRDDDTYWATDDGAAPATLELDTEGAIDVNAVELAEPHGCTGQVQAYKVEGFAQSAWRLLAAGTTIGERKIERFPRVTLWKVRLTILKAKPFAAVSTLGLYLEKQ